MNEEHDGAQRALNNGFAPPDGSSRGSIGPELSGSAKEATAR